MKKYLQFTRAHTAPLEIVPGVIGASLATGTFWSVQTLIWGGYGLLYHLAGYGMNSYTDWKSGYDKKDPHKEHHPLNTGVIEPETAKILTYSLLVITAVYAFVAVSNLASLIVLSIGVISGIIYNLFGKETELKFIFISIAHTTVFAVPYLSSGGYLGDEVFIYGTIYMFLWVVFQISVSGEIKDIMTDESNFLKYLGTEASFGVLKTSLTSTLYGITLKLITFLALILMVISITESAAVVIFVGIIGVLSVVITGRLLASGRYNRPRRLKDMALVEMTMVFALIFSVVSVTGIITTTFLAVFSTTWVILFNYIEWGTYVGPRV